MHRNLIFLVLFLLPARGLAQSPAEGVHVWRLDAAAAEAFYARDWARAESLLAIRVGISPLDGHAFDLLGTARYALRDFPGAIDAYTRAVELGGGQPWVTTYNLACCHALAGDREQALSWLERSLALRWENRPHILEDTDLTILHDDPRWPEVAQTLAPDTHLDRTAGWRHDLAVFGKEVRRLHGDPFRFVTEAELDRQVADLAARVPDLTDDEVRLEIHRIIVLLGDGHSRVRFERMDPPPPRLPVSLYAFADGLHVIEAEDPDLVGLRLVRLGSIPGNQALDRVAPYVPRDNPMGLVWMGPYYLSQATVLAALGVIDTPGDEVELVLADPAGAERTVTLAATIGHHPRIGLLPRTDDPPVWLRHPDRSYWFTDLPGVDAVYVQFNSVRDEPDRPLAEFARDLHEHLGANRPANVVLDIRRNGGGNSFLYPPLVRALVAYRMDQPDARLFCLAGRNTFSAAQNFATDIDTWTRAIFVGEPTGSRPSFVGESTDTVLPWSGTPLGLSSRYHQTSVPGDERLWIAPDVPVTLTAADYASGRDPVMEAVLVIVGGGGGDAD